MTSFLESKLFWLTSLFGVIIIIALLYDKSPSFRYRLKFAIYIGVGSLVALYMIPLCLFRPKNVKNVLIGVPGFRLLSRVLGIRWEISGKEILEKDFPCVVICNHQSMLDVLVIVELWPTMKKCACIAKNEIIYVFPFGIMAWLCGTIFINRRKSGESQVKISTTAEIIRENKTKMWIFPEGTRSKKEDLLPFKKGAFHIAMTHKLPIVPVIVSPYYFIDDNKKSFDSGIMQMKILDPIDTSILQYPEDVSKLTQNCQKLMNLELQKMKQEMRLTSKGEKMILNESNKNNSLNSTGDIVGKLNGHTNGQVQAAAEQQEVIS